MTANGLMIRKPTIVVALLALALAAFAAIAVVDAPRADAAPAVCEQYPDLPDCDGGTDPTDPGNNPGDTNGVPGGNGPTASIDASAGDELPFTGYPVTGLVLLLLILLATGLAIRAYLAYRGRGSDNAHA